MEGVDNMEVVFRGRGQEARFNKLAERQIDLTCYPDHPTMIQLGIQESVLHLLNQIGWTGYHLFRKFSTYRKLTLEFLSSLTYLPNSGQGLRKGVILFRLFGMEFNFCMEDFAKMLELPHGADAYAKVAEENLPYWELEKFWGKITGNDNPEENEFHSENIHNPAFRYFHKILAHYIFGKPDNVTEVTREELFIMFCSSQNRPVNAIAFMLTNFERITQDEVSPIRIGGFVTMIANAIGMRVPLLRLTPYGTHTSMDINYCFNRGIIGNLGPHRFELLIDNKVWYQFTLPNPKTSVHNPANWLYYGQIPEREPSPETPQAYEHFDEEMYVSESEPETPPGYYEPLPEDEPIPKYEPLPEDEPIPDYEPLSEDEPIPEYEPETPSEDSADEYTVDMTDVVLEPQQPATSTASVNQRMPNLNTNEQAITALQQDVQHVRDELHTLQMHFFDFIDTVNAQFDEVFKHIYSNVNNNRRG